MSKTYLSSVEIIVTNYKETDNNLLRVSKSSFEREAVLT